MDVLVGLVVLVVLVIEVVVATRWETRRGQRRDARRVSRRFVKRLTYAPQAFGPRGSVAPGPARRRGQGRVLLHAFAPFEIHAEIEHLRPQCVVFAVPVASR